MIVVLDTGPLGRVSNPRASDLNLACHQWLQSLLRQDIPVFIPEIADYEVRWELLRARKLRGLARLDLLKETLEYLPLTTLIMLRAAELWAQARQQGYPTADLQALDGDVILAAQALTLHGTVATDNVGHLSRFIDVEERREEEKEAWDFLLIECKILSTGDLGLEEHMLFASHFFQAGQHGCCQFLVVGNDWGFLGDGWRRS